MAGDSSYTEELDRVQRWMQAVITHPDGVLDGADSEKATRLIDAGGGKLESVVTRSRALSASDRLAIYGNAYYARLLECLGEVFPVLKRTLGEELFNGFGFGYLQLFPSKSYTLNHLGDQFVTYLEETRPEAESSGDDESDSGWIDFMIDLARLEWMIYDVFDGPGLENADAFNLPDLLEANPGDWLDLRIRMAPCLQFLITDYPVNDHYTLVRQTEGELEVDYPKPARQYLAISRRNYVVRRYSLTFPQYELLTAMKEGHTLGEALGRCAEASQDEAMDSLESDLALWFKNWAGEACFFAGEN